MIWFSPKVVSVALLCALAGGAQERLPYEGTESIVGSLLEVDVGLILSTWKIKGVMVCTRDGRPNACLLIENAYPCGIMEVVRQPGRSHLVEASPLRLLADIGISSSHTVQSDQGSHLQFAEAHVYTFVPPLLFEGLPIIHPLGPLFQVSYFSEIDGFNWRSAFADYVLDSEAAAKHLALPSCEAAPRLEDCAGKWGSYVPRIGFVRPWSNGCRPTCSESFRVSAVSRRRTSGRCGPFTWPGPRRSEISHSP